MTVLIIGDALVWAWIALRKRTQWQAAGMPNSYVTTAALLGLVFPLAILYVWYVDCFKIVGTSGESVAMRPSPPSAPQRLASFEASLDRRLEAMGIFEIGASTLARTIPEDSDARVEAVIRGWDSTYLILTNHSLWAVKGKRLRAKLEWSLALDEVERVEVLHSRTGSLFGLNLSIETATDAQLFEVSVSDYKVNQSFRDESKATAEMMAARIRSLQRPQPAATEESSIADTLERLAVLRRDGVLSDDEFQTAKRRLLGGP